MSCIANIPYIRFSRTSATGSLSLFSMPPSSSTWLFAVDFHLMRLMSTYWITFFYRWNPLCQPTVVALGTGWKSRLAKRSCCPLLLRSSSSNLLSVIQEYVDIHLLLPLVKFLTGWEENSRADSEEQRGTYKLDRLNKIFWFVLRCEWFRIHSPSRVLLRASYGYHFPLLDMVPFSIPSRPIFMCLGLWTVLQCYSCDYWSLIGFQNFVFSVP